MTHNRGRYVIALGGLWRLYTHAMPGWQMLGTIQRGMDIGALGQSQASVFAQVNAGTVRNLDQRKARAAIDAARKENSMQQRQSVGVVIPDNLDFSELALARDPRTGELEFDWRPIERICETNNIDVALFRESDESNVSGLIMEWYAIHLQLGRARDTVMDELITEAEIEDQHGGGLSHEPGHA